VRLPDGCSDLADEVSSAFAAVLTAGQVRVLCEWVAGTVVAGSACETLVTTALVETLGAGSEHAVRQRLRELLCDGDERAAPAQVHLDPRACFAPLLAWVRQRWPAPAVALAVDLTAHTDHLTAIVISLLTQGRAIPVAWHLLPAGQPGAVIEPLLTLFTALAPALATATTVTVAADRGLWSPRLADHLAALGWVGLLRVQSDVSLWLGRGQRLPARRLVAGPGHAWVGRVTVHKHRAQRRVQTVLVAWDHGHAEPWVIFTTLPVAQATTALRWYGLRMWIEAGFRDLKRMGWQWERTRRHQPVRVARHWVVLAVATTWALAHGHLPPGPDAAVATAQPPPRVSAVQRGRFRLLGRMFGVNAVAPAPVIIDPWPRPDTPPFHLSIHTAPVYVPARTRSRHPPSVNLPM
jgi:hypothetical protein